MDESPRPVRYWPTRTPSHYERPPKYPGTLGNGAMAHRAVLNVLRERAGTPVTVDDVVTALNTADRDGVTRVLHGIATHGSGDVQRVGDGYVYDPRAEWL